MTPHSKILVLADGDDVARLVRSAVGSRAAAHVEAVQGPFARLNGKAVEIFARHDLLVFEADPDDETEMRLLADLAARGTPGKPMIALTDGEVTLNKARRLQALGVGEVLPRGVDGEELGRSIRAMLDRRAKGAGDGGSAEGAVFSFAQARGGIGATTIAVNLAQALQARPRPRRAPPTRVVLVDLDLQFGNANVFLDLEDNGGLMKLIESPQAPDTTYMRSVTMQHPSGLAVISAPVPLAPLNAVRMTTIGAMIDVLRSEYDFVVVDLPRAMVDWIEPILARTTRLGLVMDTTVPCIRQARRMLDFYREANVRLAVDLVVNRERKPFFPTRHLKEAEAALGARLAYWIPENAQLARRAVDIGVPLVTQYPHSDIGKALRKMASKIAAAHAAAATRTA